MADPQFPPRSPSPRVLITGKTPFEPDPLPEAPEVYGPTEPPPEPPPLTDWRRYADEGLDAIVSSVKGFTGLGDQGPAGPTTTNAAAILGAALPVAGVVKRARAPRLKMDAPTRLGRATSQGYTDPLTSPHFHETFRANEPTLLKKGFNLKFREGSSTEDLFPPGVFLKPTDAPTGLKDPTPGASTLPSSHPYRSGPVQMELRHRAQNIREFADRTDMEQYLIANDPVYTRRRYDVENLRATIQADYNQLEQHARVAHMQGDRARVAQLQQAADDMFRQQLPQLHALSQRAREASGAHFKRQGFEGIRMLSDEGGGRFVETTLIFDPRQVRSVNARFDPRRMNSKSLLASLLPFGVATAGAGAAGLAGTGGADDGGEDQVGTPPPVFSFPRR